MQENKFSYIRSFSSFFYILLGGQVLLATIMIGLVLLGYLDPFPWEYYSANLVFPGFAVCIIAWYASNYLYKKKLGEILNSNQSNKIKLENYMTATIQRWSIMEFAILSCIILVYLSGNIVLVILLVVMIFLFTLTYPTSSKIIADLDIEV